MKVSVKIIGGGGGGLAPPLAPPSVRHCVHVIKSRAQISGEGAETLYHNRKGLNS